LNQKEVKKIPSKIMKKLSLIISIIILYGTFHFISAQKYETVKLKLPGLPWHVSYMPKTGSLLYYFHSTGDITEDVTTDIYNIDVSGKIIKKDTEKLSYEETKSKYPWYFYEGKRTVKTDYYIYAPFNAFLFEKQNWKELFHEKNLFYEKIIKVSGNMSEKVKYEGTILKANDYIHLKDYIYLLESKDQGDFIFQGNVDLTYKIKKLDYGKVENQEVDFINNSKNEISGIIIRADFKEESEEYKKGKKKLIVHLDKDFNIDKKYIFDNSYLYSKLGDNYFYKVVEDNQNKSYLFDQQLNVLEEKEIKTFPLNKAKSYDILLNYQGTATYLGGYSVSIIDRENNIIAEKKLDHADNYSIEHYNEEHYKYQELADGYYYSIINLYNSKDKRKGFIYIKAKHDKIINTKTFYEDLDNVISYKGRMPSDSKINNAYFSSSRILQAKDGGIFNSMQYEEYTFLQAYDKEGNLKETYYRKIDNVYSTISAASPSSDIYVTHATFDNASKNIIEGEKNIYWINGTHKIAITVIDKTSKAITNIIQIKQDIFPWAVNVTKGYINIPTKKGDLITIKFE